MPGDAVGPRDLPHVALPAGGSGPPVLIIHSWWGLTSSFVALADRLAEAGHLAGCVDLFQGGLAATEEEARALRTAKREEPMYRTLQRAMTRLGQHPGATRVDPAVVGFSMGGHWAVWLAQHPPPEVSGTVLYYSARAGSFAETSSPILAHFAEVDSYVSTAARRRMERAIAARGLAYRAHDYPGTAHWFAELDNPAYDRAASETALARTVAFLDDLQRP